MRVIVRFVVTSLSLAIAGAGTVQAQACPLVPVNAPAADARRLTADACAKAVDMFQFVAPQVSAVMAGGNPSPGIGGTLGGFPHFNVGVRVNVVEGWLPRVDQASPALGFAGAQASNIPVERAFLPMPQVDAQLGLFRGFRLGLPIPFLGITNVLGVDALASASFVPSAKATAAGGGVSLDGGGLAIGYGVRVGIFEESLLAPGLAVSVMRRPSPTVGLTATRGADSLSLSQATVTTTSIRVTASKTIPFLGLGLSAGIGQDNVDGDATLAYSVTPPALLSPSGLVRGSASSSLSTSRGNMFVGAHLKILVVRLSAEYGIVNAGVNPTLQNVFTRGGAQALPMDSRRYVSIAARIGL